MSGWYENRGGVGYTIWLLLQIAVGASGIWLVCPERSFIFGSGTGVRFWKGG